MLNNVWFPGKPVHLVLMAARVGHVDTDDLTYSKSISSFNSC